jgi:formate dehydrogenase assembly factor FdhD
LTNQEPMNPTQRIQVLKTKSNTAVSDHVVGEEPLEIRIDGGAGLQQLAITMRTPGADIELGAGFLWTEDRQKGLMVKEQVKLLFFNV